MTDPLRIDGDLELVQARVAGIHDQLIRLSGELEVLIQSTGEVVSLVSGLRARIKEETS